MKRLRLYLAGLLVLSPFTAHSQVEELSNTEMTEAYILDGSIIVKQKAAQAKPSNTKKAALKVGPGKPAISEAEQVLELDQQAVQQLQFDQQVTQQQGAQQLNQYEQANSTALFIAPPLNPAAQAQQLQAQALVRDGLGLPEGTQITPEMMGQYLSTFAGQSSGNPLQGQQTVTADSFQFIIPNPSSIQNGSYNSGDGSINVESNNAQIIFNLLFPKDP